jgi:type VI secretion system secreted protein Hcp
MAVDMFLEIDGIKGESKDDAHKEKIDILAWSWGLSQSGSMHIGGGGGAGKVSVQDISFTKYIDKASPSLFLFCCTGKHIATATLIVRKAGDKPVEYLKIELEGVLISSVSMGGSGGEDRLTENFSLNFAKVTHKYTPQQADGTADAEMEAGFNIEENIAI